MRGFIRISVNRWLLCGICFSFFALFEPASLFSADSSVNYSYKNPRAILAEVSKRGASAVIAELYSSPIKWNSILKQIATGTENWLKVAVALHPNSDAGAREMLTLSVGEALGTAPASVFKITLNEFQLKSICGGPDIDDARYDSYELAIKAINQRQKSILSVTDPKLKDACSKCTQFLEESKAGIAKYYENRLKR